jgi:predicted RNA binding protein YcfA (HicA-like mRNA interferase family)
MSPRLPRDVSGPELAKLLEAYGYVATRQKGSHIRLTTHEGGEHHVTVPNHDPLREGNAQRHSQGCRSPRRLGARLGRGAVVRLTRCTWALHATPAAGVRVRSSRLPPSVKDAAGDRPEGSPATATRWVVGGCRELPHGIRWPSRDRKDDCRPDCGFGPPRRRRA